MDLAERAEVRLLAVTAALIRELARDQDNFRAASDWAIAGGDVEAALRLAPAHTCLLNHRGRYREARDGLHRALALPGGPAPVRGIAMWFVGIAQFSLGDLDGLQPRRNGDGRGM